MALEPGDQPVVVTITYDRDGDVMLSPPKRRELRITLGLARTFARAAEVNRDDATPLSFTSLLVAMLTGSDPASMWVKDHLHGQGVTARKVGERRSRKFDENSLASMSDPFSLPDLAASLSARRAIEQAQAIAFSLDSGSPLDVRHLAAAYPVLPDWHAEDFIELGIDRLHWVRALGAHMAESYLAERWYWQQYADRASPVPLTSFSADVYTEKDLLGIDRSVDALALLMASTRTDTPLSIGVFGPWGSGKSFFMRHLRRRIWTLAEREQHRVQEWMTKRRSGKATAEDAPLYYGQVAQVEFNAWHYNEGNLVASLVDHLFRNLRVLPGPKDTALEERRTAVLLQISGAKAEVKDATKAIELREQEVARAREAVERASSEAESARTEVDAKAKELEGSSRLAEEARTDIDAALKTLATTTDTPDTGTLIAVALRPLTDSPMLAAATETFRNFGREADSWRTFAARVFSRRGAIVAGLCLMALLAARLTDWLTDAWTAVLALAASLTAGATGLRSAMEFVRESRRQFEATLTKLEQEEATRRQQRQSELEAEAASVQARWNDKLITLRATLEHQRAALAEREAAVAAAVRALAERTKALDQKMQERASAEVMLRDAEAQLKRLSSALLLDEFIKERSATDDYRKQLGLLALVRRDFERLSDLISAANEEWCDPAVDTPPPLLNRIVLYIDDLDRCKVKTVLSVIEAVHLLLAFPLFVCVVAVDPRWIEECLRQKHQYLFGDERSTGDETCRNGESHESVRVTVGDYLEKVFQIPIWMTPIDPRQRATLVKSLLGSTAAPEPKGASAAIASGHEPPVPPRLGERDPVGANLSDGFQAAVANAQQRPDPLRITSAEAEFVDRVARLLSDKPRALKRFVNTYRLLKASLPDIDRQSFVSDDPSSPHKICISQLAFFTGQPHLAPVFVRLLAPANGDQANGDQTTLQEWSDALPDSVRPALQDAIQLIPDAAQTRLEKFREWLPDTTKYLFHRAS